MSELDLSGNQADYVVEQVPHEGAWVPVLLGVGPFNAGEMHALTGIEVVAFADGRLTLSETGLAQAQPLTGSRADSAPSDGLVRLASWVMGDQGDGSQEGQLDGPAQSVVVRAVAVETGAVGGSQATGRSAVNDLEPSSPAAPAVSSAEATARAPSVTRSREVNAAPAATESDAPEGPMPNGVTGPSQFSDSNLATGPLTLPESPSASLGGRPPSIGAPQSLASPTEAEPFFRKPLEIMGSQGPDRLQGSDGAEVLDGLINTEAPSGVFFEQIMGAGGNDRLLYRGFAGDAGVQEVSAQLDGGRGNDVLDVMMDGRTRIEVGGGEGIDGLMLQTPAGQASPWDSDFLDWQWDFSTGGPLLTAQYLAEGQQGGLFEVDAQLEWVSSGASSPLILVRPKGEPTADIQGTASADWILSGPNTSSIRAHAGDDVVLAKAGVTVSLGAGVNTLYADSADFTLSYADSALAVRLNMANRLGLVFDDESNVYAIDRLMDVPLHAVGSQQSDVMVGNSADNTLQTGGGADRLWGGAGADHFVVDWVNGPGVVQIGDWNVAQGDRLTLNLSGEQAGSLATFDRFEVADAQGQSMWSGALGDATEEGAILSLMLSSQTNTLYWAKGPDPAQAWVTFDVPVDSLTAEQWASVISVDYL